MVTAVVVVLPFTAFLLGFDEWDVGAIYFAFGGAFSVLVGVLLRRSTRLADELRVADAELAEAAAREERHRIARDVHDLVAHSLTVVVLHVGGARRVLRSDPDAAEAALVEAERVSRESLDAIRGAVGLLRDDDEPEVRSLDLERLVTTYRSAGLPVELDDRGHPGVPAARGPGHAVPGRAGGAGERGAAQPAGHPDERRHPNRRRVRGRAHRERATRRRRTGVRRERRRSRAGSGCSDSANRQPRSGASSSAVPTGDAWVVECRLPIAELGMTAELRVIIADDQAMVRAGLALILGAEPDIAVVAECEDGTSVLSKVRAHQPDLVLMDVRMPNVDGPEATRRLQTLAAPPPVLALTTFDDDAVLWGALTAGAAGFVLKDSPAEVLITAVRAVAGGGAWLDPRVLPRVLARARDGSPRLSDRHARPRTAHAARARGPPPHLSRRHQRRDRRRVARRGAHGEVARVGDLLEARGARSGRSDHRGVRRGAALASSRGHGGHRARRPGVAGCRVVPGASSSRCSPNGFRTDSIRR